MTTLLDTPRRRTRSERAGRTLERTARQHKHLAGALGVGRPRASQMIAGRYPRLRRAYETVEKLARAERCTPTPIGSDLITYGTECAFGDLEIPQLLRELSARIEALRDGAEAAMEVAGIMQLLSERGVAPTPEGP